VFDETLDPPPGPLGDGVVPDQPDMRADPLAAVSAVATPNRARRSGTPRSVATQCDCGVSRRWWPRSPTHRGTGDRRDALAGGQRRLQPWRGQHAHPSPGHRTGGRGQRPTLGVRTPPTTPHRGQRRSACRSVVLHHRQLPSGRFNANAAWAILAAITHNLLLAAGSLVSRFHAKTRGATLQPPPDHRPRPSGPTPGLSHPASPRLLALARCLARPPHHRHRPTTGRLTRPSASPGPRCTPPWRSWAAQ
jgi:hypothetical protein